MQQHCCTPASTHQSLQRTQPRMLRAACSPKFKVIALNERWVKFLVCCCVLAELLSVSLPQRTATWAVSPLCGLDNKRILVRVVVELLHHTVGLNGRHRSRTLGPRGEVSAVAPCCLIRYSTTAWCGPFSSTSVSVQPAGRHSSRLDYRTSNPLVTRMLMFKSVWMERRSQMRNMPS